MIRRSLVLWGVWVSGSVAGAVIGGILLASANLTEERLTFFPGGVGAALGAGVAQGGVLWRGYGLGRLSAIVLALIVPEAVLLRGKFYSAALFVSGAGGFLGLCQGLVLWRERLEAVIWWAAASVAAAGVAGIAVSWAESWPALPLTLGLGLLMATNISVYSAVTGLMLVWLMGHPSPNLRP